MPAALGFAKDARTLDHLAESREEAFVAFAVAAFDDHGRTPFVSGARRYTDDLRAKFPSSSAEERENFAQTMSRNSLVYLIRLRFSKAGPTPPTLLLARGRLQRS